MGSHFPSRSYPEEKQLIRAPAKWAELLQYSGHVYEHMVNNLLLRKLHQPRSTAIRFFNTICGSPEMTNKPAAMFL